MSGLFDGTSLERPVTCERCGQVLGDCGCPRGSDGSVVLPSDQDLRVQREKRRGKWTTTVRGFDPQATDLKAMVKTLRSRLGAGGTVRDGVIELQGDHADTLVEHLKGEGYSVKRSGG